MLLAKINLNKFLKKTTVLILLLALSSCTKDSATKDPTFSLPPETQAGANTFGVTINGKVYVPRDPKGISRPDMKYKGDSTLPWSEIVVIDGPSAVEL